jgi:hypothetical protein
MTLILSPVFLVYNQILKNADIKECRKYERFPFKAGTAG